MIDKTKQFLVILNSVQGLDFKKLQILLEHFQSTEAILTAGADELKKINGIPEGLAQKIASARKDFDLDKELLLIKQNGVKLVSVTDTDYPANLKQIYDPPIVLYVKGRIIPDDFASVAIVGSRLASLYGRNFAQKLAMEFSYAGITVVSGMARGIDSSAHKGAITAGGRTVAVLGSGLSEIYPPENVKLFGEIEKSGAVVSEFPMLTLPRKENFPKRNRIISGLSLGVVIAEAAQRSGSLITANCALEQNREVFAVPGNADSRGFAGANELIKHGAKLITCAEDVIDELRPQLQGYIKERLQAVKTEEVLQTQKDKGELDGRDSEILRVLDNKKIYIDEIAEKTGVSVADTTASLVRLQIKGLVKEFPGKLFNKKR